MIVLSATMGRHKSIDFNFNAKPCINRNIASIFDPAPLLKNLAEDEETARSAALI